MARALSPAAPALMRAFGSPGTSGFCGLSRGHSHGPRPRTDDESRSSVPLPDTYASAILVCMKKTVNVDPKLLKEARQACGAKTDTDTIREGLEALVRHAAYQRLRALIGSEPNAQDVPRRREKPVTRRKVA